VFQIVKVYGCSTVVCDGPGLLCRYVIDSTMARYDVISLHELYISSAQLSTPPTPTIDEAPLQMPVVLQESSHDISPVSISMAVIMVIIFLGATLVVAINVVIVGMAYKP